jgi:hypothetical protein
MSNRTDCGVSEVNVVVIQGAGPDGGMPCPFAIESNSKDKVSAAADAVCATHAIKDNAATANNSRINFMLC